MKPEPYPLHWPETWPRTSTFRRKRSRFGKHGFGQIRDTLLAELRRLGAKQIVLSTGIPLRLDGLPYANRAEGEDPGAAVYFQWRGKPFVIACDSYVRTWENVKAVAKTIEAMRAIERHGATQLLERAVAGFSALPPGAESGDAPEPEEPWWDALGIPPFDGMPISEIASDSTHHMRTPMLKMAEAIYKTKVQEAHPDRGGSNHAMRKLNVAIKAARESLGA